MSGTGVLALAGAWALLVVAGAWRHRPSPVRVRGLGSARPGRCATAPSSPVVPGRAVDLVERLGRRLMRWGRHPASDEQCRRLGLAVIVGFVAALVSPVLVPVAMVGVWMVPRALAARGDSRRRAAMAADLPDVVDLLSLVAGAGLTVGLAVQEVGRRGSGPIAAELARVTDQVALGRRLADALEHLPSPQRAGEAARGLVAALVASERYGAPLAPALDRISFQVRADRRRRAEEAARKVPVKLLFPLVTCTLPAFALLTVAPLIASALRSLRL